MTSCTGFFSIGMKEAEIISLTISLSTPSGVGSIIQTGMTRKPSLENILKYPCAARLSPEGFKKHVSTRSTINSSLDRPTDNHTNLFHSKQVNKAWLSKYNKEQMDIKEQKHDQNWNWCNLPT
jgi:hypothetical protein